MYNNNYGGLPRNQQDSSMMLYVLVAACVCCISLSLVMSTLGSSTVTPTIAPVATVPTEMIVPETPDDDPADTDTDSKKKKKKKKKNNTNNNDSNKNEEDNSKIPTGETTYIYLNKGNCSGGVVALGYPTTQCQEGTEIATWTASSGTGSTKWVIVKDGAYHRIRTATKCGGKYLYVTYCAGASKCPVTDHIGNQTGPRLQKKMNTKAQLWILKGTSSKGYTFVPAWFSTNPDKHKFLGSWCKPSDRATWFGTSDGPNNRWLIRRSSTGLPRA